MMNDFMKGLREQAVEKEKGRKNGGPRSKKEFLREKEKAKIDEVAEFLNTSPELVENCCGYTCPDCQMFLDKALALEKLGHDSHLFLNPTQEEVYAEAKKLFNEDREEYSRRRNELMNAMRQQPA